MAERKYANYLEVIDLLDRVFPAKQDFNYIEIAPMELVRKFNEEVKASGFYFREATLTKVRDTILRYQERNYNRNSVFLGADPNRDYGFDQNNYSIQNNLSEMKNSIIGLLTLNEGLLVPGSSYSVRGLGEMADIREKTSREKIEEYVRKVITVTWEPESDIRAEVYPIANDIFLHFGLSTGNFFGKNSTYDKVYSALDRLFYDSKNYRGPVDSEGNYDSAKTNEELYDKLLQETVYNVTEILYGTIKDTLDSIELSEARREAKKQKEEKGPFVGISTEIDEMSQQYAEYQAQKEKEKQEEGPLYGIDPEIDEMSRQYAEYEAMKNKERKEKTLDDLDAIISKNESLQGLLAKQVQLAKELKAAREKRIEAEAKAKAAKDAELGLEQQIRNIEEKIRSIH